MSYEDIKAEMIRLECARDDAEFARIVLAASAPTETRTSCAATGGEKGVKAERFSLIPAEPMKAVARVYGYGSQKYSADNWRRGYEWSKALDALERHLNAYKACQDTDPESGEPHLAHLVFHCLSLMEWSKTHPELDDRWREGNK